MLISLAMAVLNSRLLIKMNTFQINTNICDLDWKKKEFILSDKPCLCNFSKFNSGKLTAALNNQLLVRK